jgi:hypothetical protein
MVNHTEKINVDWNNNAHVLVLGNSGINTVKSYKLPNNAVIILQLSDEYLLIYTSVDGDIVETFKCFEELNEYLRENFDFEVNKPDVKEIC